MHLNSALLLYPQIPLLSTHIFKKIIFFRVIQNTNEDTQKSRFPLNRKRDFSTIYPSLVEKSVNSSALLMGGNHDLQAAHIRLQHFGDGHGAVGLQMVLQEGDQHTRRCHAGVVQGVGQIGLAVLALHADVQAACLCIAQIGAGADLDRKSVV